MVANVEAMVRAGIEAYRGGKNAEARKLLEKAIELDDYNEQAWMWLSAVVETEDEKRTCLENVLVINPENEEAQRGLKMLGVDGSAPAITSDTATTANPFTETGMADFGDVDFTADSDDDWGGAPPTETSSSSSTYKPPETSAGEYDEWVSNLGLGASGETPSDGNDAFGASSGGSSAFATESVDDMFGLDTDDDIFGSSADPFGSESQSQYDDVDPSDSLTSGPFGSDDSFNDDFGFDDTPEPAQATPPPSPVMSPGAENIDDDDGFFDDLDDAEFAGGDFIIGDEAFEDDGQSDLTPDELFSFIPDEIKATHLPGSGGGSGIGGILIVVVLIVLNVGALAFIFTSM